MAQPMDRMKDLPPVGELDTERGEFWIENPWKMNSRPLGGEKKNGDSSEEKPQVYWETLALLDYEKAVVPDDLRKFDKKVVEIPGFAVPLEDDATTRDLVVVHDHKPTSTFDVGNTVERDRPRRLEDDLGNVMAINSLLVLLRRQF